MKNIIGFRILKTSIGASLAIIIAQWLGLKYAAAAGIITILSVHNTTKTSIKLAVQRIESTILALLISSLLFLILGYNPVTFGVYLAIFIPLTVVLKITDGIAVSSVLVTHLLAEKSISMFWIKNEILLMTIGAGIGIILNIYMPKIENEIKETQENIEEHMRKILFHMAEDLRNQSVHIEEEKLFNNLERMLKEGTESAYRHLNNYLISDVKYYVQYMEMRTLQYEVLKYMRSHFIKFYMTFEQTEIVAAFTEKVASNFGEYNTAEELLKELNEVINMFKVQELPKTREEFENRAMLFQFLNDMEALLELKKNFREKYKNNFEKIVS
ncbi:MAG: aromatic acid exporter family protein [Clostridiaceae bacterium]